MASELVFPDDLVIAAQSIVFKTHAGVTALSQPTLTTRHTIATTGQTAVNPIIAPVGAVTAPGITFTGDLDCGLYRIGANNIGVAVNGALVADVRTVGVYVTGNVALGAVSAFATTEPVSATTYKTGTAPAGAVTTSGGVFTDGTTMKKIIAAGTVSDIQT